MTYKKWAGLAAIAILAVAVLAGKDDIQRFLRMRAM
jgi:hypothetical protein